MSNLPVMDLSPEDQQRLMGQMYVLIAKQVQSYHQHHGLGEHSSVPVEFARELTASVEYTVELAGGLAAVGDAERALRMGQEILQEKAEMARKLLELVCATAPEWQTECRWDALQELRRYLAGYDLLHLAHHGPDGLFYPIPIPVPDGLRGMELAYFYIRVLWLENQIMAAFSDEFLEEIWNDLSPDTLNQCEELIIRALGSPGCTAQSVAEASRQLCRRLALSMPAEEYLCAAVAHLGTRIFEN